MVDIVKGDAEVSKKAMRIDEKIRDAREEGREEIRALLGAKTEEAEKRAEIAEARAEQIEAKLENLLKKLADMGIDKVIE